MHFTFADDVTGRGISFDTVCECDFDQFCIYFILNNQVMVINISKTECFLSKNHHIGRECECWSFYETTPLQCILCSPNSLPNKCTLSVFSGISSAGS